ncbi:IclR family transcriptional regulator [Bradyrhizobium sp. dw_411]|uniref:IclR family transcriptional regulator n=1 Tax=Bradyrhizobium sp. dw_411 TaxID=2720082 RepID=UPI001BCE6B6E|nr:IclR family transcriptional regulator [Bradyrhizobium sp. dw_411]
MAVLEALADRPAGMSVSDLSALTGLNKGSIARVLITLESTGHVLQDAGTERYHLSLQTVSLANRHMDRLGFPELIQPVLNDLSDATGELAQLAAADNDRLYVIAKAEGANRIRVESLLGQQIALHASSTGKAWLSGLSRERLLRVLGGVELVKLTTQTITDISVLEQEIEEARAAGFATQREELMEQMSGIAVPVRISASPEALGSLAIAAPTFRFPFDRITELHAMLQRAASRIGETWPREAVFANLDHPARKIAFR